MTALQQPSTGPGEELPLVVREIRPQFCLATLHNVALIYWNQPPDLAAFNRAEQHLLELFRQYPQGAGMIILSRARTPPGGEIAKEGAAQLDRWGKSVFALAAVQEQTGILSALIRVMMQTISTLAASKNSVRPKLFGNLDEAAKWMGTTMHEAGKLAAGKPGDVPAAVRALCAKYPPEGEAS